MLAAQPRDPGAPPRERPAQRPHLPDLAAALAQLRVAIERVAAVILHILKDGDRIRVEHLGLEAVAAADTLDQRERIAVQAAGVENEDFDRQPCARNPA